jgi:hypothetical protein
MTPHDDRDVERAETAALLGDDGDARGDGRGRARGGDDARVDADGDGGGRRVRARGVRVDRGVDAPE